ncbi:cytoskeletal protein CcmA (bactofilin family) [Sphingomonas zeicaulis]|uniref:bactofilin family protein n=1 Tax=Sphingomonas zeicaulis TaxID=1632740 RepID=UPI003D1FE452
MFKSAKAGGNGRSKSAHALSIIGADVVINGDIAAEGALHVDGEVKGDIRCAQFTQGPNGRVAGNVMAQEARVAGRVDGTIDAQALTIEKSARITGDLSYARVSIDGGAVVDGRLTRQSVDGEPEVKLIAAE